MGFQYAGIVFHASSRSGFICIFIELRNLSSAIVGAELIVVSTVFQWDSRILDKDIRNLKPLIDISNKLLCKWAKCKGKSEADRRLNWH